MLLRAFRYPRSKRLLSNFETETPHLSQLTCAEDDALLPQPCSLHITFHMEPFQLELLSRSLGPPCSNVVHFLLEDSTSIHRAYGVPGSTIIVQSLQVKGQVQNEQPFETVAVISLHSESDSGKTDNAELISWGGGPFCLIAAATSHLISVYSLKPPKTTVPKKSSKEKKDRKKVLGMSCHVCTWETTSPAIGIAWTEDGGGLVVAETSGFVSAVSIDVESATGEGGLSSKSSRNVLDRTSLSRRKSALKADIETLWSGKVLFKQDLVAAGQNVHEPAATAADNVSTAVTVWCPKSTGGHTEETLKHPCPVIGVDWSPGGAPMTSSSALLTSCLDGVIRVWVRASLENNKILGVDMSEVDEPCAFCLVLILEPPVPFMPFQSNVRGAWVHGWKGNSTMCKTLWVVSVHQSKDESDGKMLLSLWAVDGLQNVFLCVEQGPRNILWGRSDLFDGPEGSSRVSAFMISPQPIPEVLVVESTWNAVQKSSESQILLLHCSSGQVSKLLHRNFVIDGPLSSIISLDLHPSLDMICTINSDLSVAIWDMWPVKCLTRLQSDAVSMSNGVQTACWIDYDVEGCAGHLLLAGKDGVTLCKLILDERDPFHMLVQVDTVVSVRLPENELGVKHMVGLGQSSGQSETGIFCFMVLGLFRPSCAHCLQIQFAADGGATMLFTGTYIPLGLDGKSMIEITVAKGLDLGSGVLVAGDSCGRVHLLEFDLFDGKLGASFACDLEYSGGVAGVVQSIAVCGHAPYIACTTELGPEGNENTLWIIESESRGGSIEHHVETKLPLDSAPTDVAWIKGCSLTMAVVVSFEMGGVEVFVRTRHACWEVVAQFSVALPVTCMGTTRMGLPVIAGGTHLLVLSCASEKIHQRYFLGDSVAGSSLASGGTESDYNPDSLTLFVDVGFNNIATAIGRCLGKWLEDRVEAESSQSSLTMLGPTAPLESLMGEVFSLVEFNWTDGGDIGLHVPYSLIDTPKKKFENTSKQQKREDSSNEASSGQKPISSVEATGLLDMSAFGMDGGVSSTVSQDRPAESTAQPASLEFDPSAFGFGMEAPAQEETKKVVETGMLDPSSFGFGAPASTQTPSAADTGMLDPGAFGFGMADPIPQQPPTSTNNGASSKSIIDTKKAESSTETGMLDPGAFGFGVEEVKSEKVDTCDENPEASSPHQAPLPDEEVVKERCVALRKSNFSHKSSSLQQDKGLSDHLIEILSKYAVTDEPQVELLACALGLTGNELQDSCSVVLSTLEFEKGDVSKLDEPGRRMLAGIHVWKKRKEEESTNIESGGLVTSSGNSDGLKGLPRPVSTHSLASISASYTSLNKEVGASPVTWKERVGLHKSVDAIHLLWAAQSSTPQELVSSCLELTVEDATAGGESRTAFNLTPSGTSRKDKGSTPITWGRLRALGTGFWLSDHALVSKLAEDLARAEYGESRDPHKCALLYVALGKQRLLSTLFRGAGRARVAELLGKDFGVENNQQVAAKNAFALLSKHQYSLAAAFFLLGRQYNDAVGVCEREMGDPQLGLFLATLIDGPDGEIRRRLIEQLLQPSVRIFQNLLPDVMEASCDRIPRALYLWMLGRQSEALAILTDIELTSHGYSLSHQTVCDETLVTKFVLEQGLPNLAGRYIPLSLIHQLLHHMEFCAHILGVYGLPFLGLHVLVSGASMHELDLGPPNTKSSNADRLKLRLVTALMVRHLPAPQAVCDREPYLIKWREHVRSDLKLLHQHGFGVDEDSVIENLEQLMGALFEIPSNPVHSRSHSTIPDLSTGRREAPISPESPEPSFLLCGEPRDLLRVDGDICTGVCCSRAAELQGPTPLAHLHKVAVGTGRHGMHYVEWGPPPAIDGGEYWHALRHHRWPTNRWLEPSLVRVASAESAVTLRELNTGPLISHPAVDLFLSSGKTAAVHLWKFGETAPCANFVPSFPPGSSMVKGWESPCSVCWSSSGDRLAAVGMDGSCATWQLDTATAVDNSGLSGWQDMVAPRRGCDIKFADGSGSVLVVSGEDENGHGQLRIWDTLSPRSSAEIAKLEFQGVLVEMVTIPGSQILVSGFATGIVLAHDLRMLQDELWSLPVHSGPITSMLTGWGPFGPHDAWHMVVATGGKDGDVCVIDEIKDSGVLRQRIQKAHWKKPSQLSDIFSFGLKSGFGVSSSGQSDSQGRSRPNGAIGAPVLDLGWCDEGLLTSGGDGHLQLFSWGNKTD